MEYTTAKTYQEIAKELTAYTKTSNEDYYEYGIFVDGMEYSEWMDAYGHTADGEKLEPTTTLAGFNAVMDSQNTGHFLPSNNGVLTQVFVTDKVEYMTAQGVWNVDEGKVYVSCINTYLAEVDTSIDHETGEYTTRVSYFDNVMMDSNNEDKLGLDQPRISLSVNTYEGFVEDGMVMVQASAQNLTSAGNGDGFSGDMEIVTINEPTIVEGLVTYNKLATDYVGGSYMTIDDDQTYTYSVTMRGDINNDGEAPAVDDEVVAYIDGNVDENGNGYVLGYTKVEEAPKYLYVEENYDWSYYGGVIARVTFADGSEEEISITQIDGETVTSDNEAVIPGSGRYKDSNGNVVSANENLQGSVVDGVFVPSTDSSTGAYGIENRIYGYQQLSDGSYNLTTTIQKDYDADKGASSGGLLAMTGTSDEGVANGHGTLAKATGDENGEPAKDTMAIFTSVVVPNNEANFNDLYTGTAGKSPSSVTYASKIANPYNAFSYKDDDGDDHEGYHAFAIRSGRTAVFSLDVKNTDDTAYYKEVGYYNDTQIDADGLLVSSPVATESYDTFQKTGWSLTSDFYYDNAFLVNNFTVFVDVVNNETWTGHTNMETLADYDLNMQVVFGNNGIADVVFINNGTEPVVDDGYFILMDTQPESYKDDDGNLIYKYNVYIDGEETFFLSKGSQVDVTNDYDFFEDKEVLQTNTLYFISEKDSDGYVRTVDFRYDYTPITNVLYNDSDAQTEYKKDPNGLVYNNHWSVADVVSGGVLKLRNDDQFADKSGKTDNGSWDNDGVPGEDEYYYNDSTVFVVLQANKNGDIYSIKRGSESDIKTYSTTRSSISWVDVVEASSNSGTTNPYASLVVVLQPWDNGSTSTESTSDSSYSVKDIKATASENGLTRYSAIPLEFYYHSATLESDADTLLAGVWESLKEYENYSDNAVYARTSLAAGVLTFVVTEYLNGVALDPIYYSFNVNDSTDGGDMHQWATFISLSEDQRANLSADTNKLFDSAKLDALTDAELAALCYGTEISEVVDLLYSDIGDYVRIYAAEASGTLSAGMNFLTAAEFKKLTLGDFLWDEKGTSAGAYVDNSSLGGIDLTHIYLNQVRMAVDVSELVDKIGAVTSDWTVGVTYNSSTNVSGATTDALAWEVDEDDSNVTYYYATLNDSATEDFKVTVTFEKDGALTTYADTDKATFTFKNTLETATTDLSNTDPVDQTVTIYVADGNSGVSEASKLASCVYDEGSTASFEIYQPEAIQATLYVNGSASAETYDFDLSIGELYAELYPNGSAKNVVIADTLILAETTTTAAKENYEGNAFTVNTDGVSYYAHSYTDGKSVYLPEGVTVDTGAENDAISGDLYSWFAEGTSNNVIYARDKAGDITLVFSDASNDDAKHSSGLLLSTTKFSLKANETANETDGTLIVKTSGTGATLPAAALIEGNEYKFAYIITHELASVKISGTAITTGSFVQVGEVLDIVGADTSSHYIHVSQAMSSVMTKGADEADSEVDATNSYWGFTVEETVQGEDGGASAAAQWTVGLFNNLSAGYVDTGFTITSVD